MWILGYMLILVTYENMYNIWWHMKIWKYGQKMVTYENMDKDGDIYRHRKWTCKQRRVSGDSREQRQFQPSRRRWLLSWTGRHWFVINIKWFSFFHCKTLIKVEPPQVGKELAAANIGEEHVEEALVLAAPGEVNQEWVVDFLKERKLGSFQKV